jgi:hypothetical protein
LVISEIELLGQPFYMVLQHAAHPHHPLPHATLVWSSSRYCH